MPPHCDSMDGPVVGAAREALAREDVDVILPYIYEEGEAELRTAFDLVRKVRSQGPEARELADRYFFETAVRLHRAGESAPYMGLKPAGLDVGPAVRVAESALDKGSPQPLIEFFIGAVQSEIVDRFDALNRAKQHSADGLPEARSYVGEMLGLQVWAHKLLRAIKAEAHEVT